jgi:hypothetical protein
MLPRFISRAGVAATVALFLVLVIPAVSSSASPPALRIITAASRTSSLTMKSGFSHYIFVGGSSFGAGISQTSFQHVRESACLRNATQWPIGKSASSQGSFSSSGSVSAIAGIGISGYSVKGSESNIGGIAGCGPQAPNGPFSGGFNVTTGDSVGQGDVILIVVGTLGVGTLAPSLTPNTGGNCGVNNQLTTLRNVTASESRYKGGAVAIFSISLQSSMFECWFGIYGTTFNTANESGNLAIYYTAYLLKPLK